MFTFNIHSRKWPTLFVSSLLTLSLGAVGNAAPTESSACRNLPVIKNLTRLKARVDCHNEVAPSHQFNSSHVSATTESSEDRVTLARSLREKAQNLDAEAAAYEQAAIRLGHGPFVKNLMAPTTPGRYSFYAKRLREEAQANRELAASLAASTA